MKPTTLVSLASSHVGGATTITLPIRLVCEANAHEHWRIRHARSVAQHRLCAIAFAARLPRAAELLEGEPLDVTMVRLAPRSFDQGGNRAGCTKWVQDALARYLGVDDRDESRVRYTTLEERSRSYGVRVEIRMRGGRQP